MPMNAVYRGPGDLAGRDPGLSAAGRAAAAARADAAQHLRAALSRHGGRRAAPTGHRLIGMIQPDTAHPGPARQAATSTASAASAASPSSPRPATAAILSSSPAFRAFASQQELDGHDRLPAVPRRPIAPFADDFVARKGEEEVDREALLEALTAFLKANNLKADWEGIENAPNEALVNALAMMSPYGAGREAGAAGSARPQDARRNPGRRHRDRARQEPTPAARRRCSELTARSRAIRMAPMTHVGAPHDTRPTAPPAASIRSCWKSSCARSPRARSNMTPRSRS